MCFHILGFDIMLDHKCKPYLLEVNHSPSFSTDSPIDMKVKGDLIRDTIQMLGLTKQRKATYRRNLQAQLDFRTRSGKFVRLPPDLKELYRREFEEIRHDYECQNLGAFEMIYPTESEELKLKYSELLQSSRQIYDEKHP